MGRGGGLQLGQIAEPVVGEVPVFGPPPLAGGQGHFHKRFQQGVIGATIVSEQRAEARFGAGGPARLDVAQVGLVETDMTADVFPVPAAVLADPPEFLAEPLLPLAWIRAQSHGLTSHTGHTVVSMTSGWNHSME
ncbi:hypothetical protein GCM10009801_28430 [Streptomyces albiaxialis]|uniref:Uncharacterized protein n=1 Tax=Streptomyces albiaxialis TaxID=329523 RepID=A0ABP5HHQ7_9ACTN